jgi:hypothetical protein
MMIDFIFNWYFLFFIILLLAIYGDFSKVKNGFRFKKYVNSSSLNPTELIDGKEWSSTQSLKNNLYKRSEKDFFLGEFRYSPVVLENCKLPFWFKKFHEKTKVFVTKTDLLKTTIIYGGMGSGKSIFFLNLLDHIESYDNAIVHDGGKNELVSKLYNPFRDVILNPYDERATIHDILSEDTAVQTYFFKLLLKGKSGKEDNFFSSAASEHLENIALMTNARNFTNTKDKWAFFISQIEKLIESAMNDKQKSELDVISTLKQILTPLFLMNYRIQRDAKVFTIEEFLKKNHAAKLFVSYPPQFKTRIESVSSAFIAMFTMVHLSQPDTKKKLHLYAIDECSSYIRTINDIDTLKDQLEKLRSKGGAFIGGFQGIDEDEKINGVLDKTVNQKFFFRTDGGKTREYAVKSLGKCKYRVNKVNYDSKELLDKQKSYSMDTAEIDVLKQDDFKDLGQKYEHIAVIGDNLYRGYTPLTQGEKDGVLRAEPFIQYSQRQDFEDWLALRYETIQNKKFQKQKEDALAEKMA